MNIEVQNIDLNKPDDGITFWNLIRDYVREKHPHVPLEQDNGVRFRIRVEKTGLVITDAGKSPGNGIKEECFPAADPSIFKRISSICNHPKWGNSVCVFKSRQLLSGWTIQNAPDLIALHGIDIEAELIDGMASGIEGEICKKPQ